MYMVSGDRIPPLDPPAIMGRLDAVSLSSAPSSVRVKLHDLLLENLSLPSTDRPFLCSPVADLPEAVGVATVSSLDVTYQQEIKVGDVSAVTMTAWNHYAKHSVSLAHAIQYIFSTCYTVYLYHSPSLSRHSRYIMPPHPIYRLIMFAL